MNIIKDVFFDLDRTLWDFDKNSESALRVLYEELKLNNYSASFEEFLKVYRDVNARYWNDYGAGKIDKTQLRNGRFVDTLKSFERSEERRVGKECRSRWSTYQ